MLKKLYQTFILKLIDICHTSFQGLVIIFGKKFDLFRLSSLSYVGEGGREKEFQKLPANDQILHHWTLRTIKIHASILNYESIFS